MAGLVGRLKNWTARPREGELDPTELRAIFLHISKTAGQSVRQILAPHRVVLSDVKQARLGWEDDFTYARFARDGFARVIRDEVGSEVWARCFTFTFVRNPFDRAVSAWRYLDRPAGPGFGLTFEEFVDRVTAARPRYARDDHALNKFSWHVEPQAPQIVDADGHSLVDFVGRTENLQAGFDEACRRIGIPTKKLPRVNTTRRTSYRPYYDDRTRALVAEFYAQDIERFGYSF